MPKNFYTERDIEDLVKRGIMSLEMDDSVGLTDLAYEKANRLGLKLVDNKPDNPPAAPIRPYLSEKTTQKLPEVVPTGTTPSIAESDLQQRIRSAVLTRMGSQIDPALLDAIIQRVLDSTGVK